MVAILTADGEIHEDEDSLRRKFQLYVDVAGDILRATGRAGEWLNRDHAELSGLNISKLIETQSLFLCSEVIYHAAAGERLKPVNLFLYGPDRAINGFIVRGEPVHGEDEFLLHFTRDPDMVFQGGGQNSARGLAESVRHYLALDDQPELDMTFIELGDVTGLSHDSMGYGGDTDEFTRKVEEKLRAQSIAPDAVSRVEDGKYGILHKSGADLSAMEQDIQTLVDEADPDGAYLGIATKTIELDAEGLAEEDILTAVEHAAGEFVEQGLDAIIFDTLADSQAAYIDRRQSRTELLETALKEEKLEVAYHSTVDVHVWRTDHMLAEFRADLELDGLGAQEILSLTEKDLDLRRRVDEAQIDFILKGQWQDGITVAIGLLIHSLTKAELLTKLMTFSERAGNRHVILRIEGLCPELIERIDALQILRKAGFLIALFGSEIGALNDDKLRELPADYIIMDESFSNDYRALSSGLPVLSAMGKRCASYGKTMMFEGVVIAEIAQRLSKIPGALANGPYFGRSIRNFREIRFPHKSTRRH